MNKKKIQGKEDRMLGARSESENGIKKRTAASDHQMEDLHVGSSSLNVA